MACGPAGLAADIGALAEGYRLESLRAYDTLPQTPHVELIAKLVRIEDVAP
jgi:tRNA/tmRNA/rRNA uracil-C5-methylase (TrmA/RlmC/RlmD family)